MDSEEKTIWAPYQAFYIHSMLFNTESAVSSISKINTVFNVAQVNSPEDPIPVLATRHLLGELHNFVIQAAALSRYFWPVRSAHEWRGIQLRKTFGISESSPLKSRDLRNAIEHFDEQLDKYLENGIVGHILPQYVGSFSESIGVPVHLFRAYYVDRGIFELLGKRYEINPIAMEVYAIHEQLKRMDKAGCMFGSKNILQA